MWRKKFTKQVVASLPHSTEPLIRKSAGSEFDFRNWLHILQGIKCKNSNWTPVLHQKGFSSLFRAWQRKRFSSTFRVWRAFLPSRGRNMTGNRCGHDPKHPNLSPAKPIRKGKGGLPRILSLAAERAKAWYKHPAKCPPLQRARRAIRSERQEALQIVIETILSHLDLASLCLGSSPKN